MDQRLRPIHLLWLLSFFMETTEQSQIENADQCKDTIFPLRMLVSNGTLKHKLFFYILHHGRVYGTLWLCTWLCMVQKFFWRVGKPIPHVLLYGDSRGAIFNSQTLLHKKGLNILRFATTISVNRIGKGNSKAYAISTADNMADIFTKNLGPILFLKHRQALGLEFIHSTENSHKQVCVRLTDQRCAYC